MLKIKYNLEGCRKQPFFLTTILFGNNMDKKELLAHFWELITDEKKERFMDILQHRTRHLTIVLEDIYQAQNASAVMRSVECFGVQDLHIIENKNQFDVHVDIAMGAGKWISMHRYRHFEDNTDTCLSQLKQQGYQIIGTTPHENDVDLPQLDISKKTALVFGTEFTGLSDKALALCDGFMKVPMYGFTESLNISVCAAICLQNIVERLRASDIPWQLDEENQIDVLLSWCKKSIKRSDVIEKHLQKTQQS